MKEEGIRFQNLVDLVGKLRRECPWDRQQTNQSIKNNLIEEAYELFEAIEQDDDEKMVEELGDILLQVVFHSQIKKDSGRFDINTVIEKLIQKLIRRHPHVFGDSEVSTSEEVLDQWAMIKRGEKAEKSILDGIPHRMPALMRAVKVQNRVAKVGFDWQDISQVWEKLEEEIEELKNAKTPEEKKHELGDILMAMTNLSRFMGVDPEDALHESIDRMIKRFNYIEEKAKGMNKPLEDMTLQEMDKLWDEAKKLE